MKRITQLAVLTASFSLPTTLISTSSEAALIKTNDFESGTYSGVSRQYQDKTCSSSSDYIDNQLYDIVSSPGGRSGKAVKHQIKNCDERSELVVAGGTLKTNQSNWIGWSMLLPTNHNKPGNQSYTITQQVGFQNTCWQNANGPNCNNLIKKPDGSITPKVGSPIMGMLPSIDGKNIVYDFYRYLSTDSTGRHLFDKKVFNIPSVPDKWNDFVMYVNLSSDPSKSRFKLWKNDKLYINEAGRLLPPNISTLGDWKIGAYTGEPGNGERTVYTDELRVGDSASNYLGVVNPYRRGALGGLEATDSTISSFATQSIANASFSQSDSFAELALVSSRKTVEAESVPEPTSAIAFMTLLGGFGLLKRKSEGNS